MNKKKKKPLLNINLILSFYNYLFLIKYHADFSNNIKFKRAFVLFNWTSQMNVMYICFLYVDVQKSCKKLFRED